MRPETGPMQFDDDWRGIFIRGDSALMGYLPMLQILRDKLPPEDKDLLLSLGLDGLIDLLASANHHREDDGVQMMKKFPDCRVVKLRVTNRNPNPLLRWSQVTWGGDSMKSQQELAANEETRQHIDKVRKYLRIFAVELLKRGEVHDQSKLGEVEAPTFAVYTEKLKYLTYGSEEYHKCREEMKVALDHHYAKNRHHPEHHKDGINDMTLVDIVEMFCDWLASSQRHADGNILKSIEHNKDRFGMAEQLATILENTAKLYDSESDR
jgi:hypothetical protein